jgi:hypothetical protein
LGIANAIAAMLLQFSEKANNYSIERQKEANIFLSSIGLDGIPEIISSDKNDDNSDKTQNYGSFDKTNDIKISK